MLCRRASVRGSAGVYNCGSTIVREEGVRSLWKGLTPFAGNLTLKYFLRFGTNAFYQNLLRDSVRRRSTTPSRHTGRQHSGSAWPCVLVTKQVEGRELC